MNSTSAPVAKPATERTVRQWLALCREFGIDGEAWLDTPQGELMGKTPRQVIESRADDDLWVRQQLANRFDMIRGGLYG
jgi:hypothetical protein